MPLSQLTGLFMLGVFYNKKGFFFFKFLFSLSVGIIKSKFYLKIHK